MQASHGYMQFDPSQRPPDDLKLVRVHTMQQDTPYTSRALGSALSPAIPSAVICQPGTQLETPASTSSATAVDAHLNASTGLDKRAQPSGALSKMHTRLNLSR